MVVKYTHRSFLSNKYDSKQVGSKSFRLSLVRKCSVKLTGSGRAQHMKQNGFDLSKILDQHVNLKCPSGVGKDCFAKLGNIKGQTFEQTNLHELLCQLVPKEAQAGKPTSSNSTVSGHSGHYVKITEECEVTARSQFRSPLVSLINKAKPTYILHEVLKVLNAKSSILRLLSGYPLRLEIFCFLYI